MYFYFLYTHHTVASISNILEHIRLLFEEHWLYLLQLSCSNMQHRTFFLLKFSKPWVMHRREEHRWCASNSSIKTHGPRPKQTVPMAPQNDDAPKRWNKTGNRHQIPKTVCQTTWAWTSVPLQNRISGQLFWCCEGWSDRMIGKGTTDWLDWLWTVN